jgi:RNA polymerase sigma factor (sigma-70 family)
MTKTQVEQLTAVVEAIALLYRTSGVCLEDLKQEGWLAAIESYNRWYKEDQGASITTFLRPRIHWAIQKFVRAQKYPAGSVSFDAPVAVSGDSDRPANLHESIGVPGAQESEQELKERLETLREKYPTKTVDLLILRAQGFSFREISAELKLSEESARQIYSRFAQSVGKKGKAAA